jgi:hypothetical protein
VELRTSAFRSTIRAAAGIGRTVRVRHDPPSASATIAGAYTEPLRSATETLADVLETLGRSQEATAIRLEIADSDPSEAK